MNLDSSVNKAKGNEMDGRVSISDKVNKLISSPQRQDRLSNAPSLPSRY
jgi:hypothetical protein